MTGQEGYEKKKLPVKKLVTKQSDKLGRVKSTIFASEMLQSRTIKLHTMEILK